MPVPYRMNVTQVGSSSLAVDPLQVRKACLAVLSRSGQTAIVTSPTARRQTLRSKLRHNTVACAPSRMTPPNRLWFWIGSLIKRKASIRPAYAYDVHSAVGRPARTISGPAPAATTGTLLIPEEYARRASTSGPQRSAFPVPAGRHIPIGMRGYELQTRCVSVVHRPWCEDWASESSGHIENGQRAA